MPAVVFFGPGKARGGIAVDAPVKAGVVHADVPAHHAPAGSTLRRVFLPAHHQPKGPPDQAVIDALAR